MALVASAAVGSGCLRRTQTVRSLRSKNWLWITSSESAESDLATWRRRFESMRAQGIRALLLEVWNGAQAFYGSRHLPVQDRWLERMLPLAKAAHLEVHAWIWCMPCNVEEIVSNHPDWYACNALGVSVVRTPPYVAYYRFLCPGQPAVHDFLRKRVAELAEYDELDGIHLDYIRYPEVILPPALQEKYGLVQEREEPQYDYCYCTGCVERCRRQLGFDPRALPDPAANAAWLKLRCDTVTGLVNETIVPVVRGRKKRLTAAVWPGWRRVRQQWPRWQIDAALVMFYHQLYKQSVDWMGSGIRAALRECELEGSRAALYAGLLVEGLSPEEIRQAIHVADDAGAAGVALFSSSTMTPEQRTAFELAIR
jgi:uncharacterized lipoprotein YddW (UPF0748 family)